MWVLVLKCSEGGVKGGTVHVTQGCEGGEIHGGSSSSTRCTCVCQRRAQRRREEESVRREELLFFVIDSCSSTHTCTCARNSIRLPSRLQPTWRVRCKEAHSNGICKCPQLRCRTRLCRIIDVSDEGVVHILRRCGMPHGW